MKGQRAARAPGGRERPGERHAPDRGLGGRTSRPVATAADQEPPPPQVTANGAYCPCCPACAWLIHGHFPGWQQGDFS